MHTVGTGSGGTIDVAAQPHRIAAHAPFALRGVKQNLLSADEHTLDDYLPGEVDRMVTTFHTADAEEAAAAFLAHRAPVFTGR